MLITLIACITLLLIFGVLHVAEKNKIRRKRERQLQGINVLKKALELVIHIQQHRGMAAALLNGDPSFSARLVAKQSEIRGLLNHLSPLLAETAELRQDTDKLLHITQLWQQLALSINSISAEQSFAQHTALIRKTIHLLGDMGEHIGLLDGEGSPLAILSNTLLLRLPLLMESIGQARALGSGYAAKGQCGAVGRIRMNFLEQHIRECQADIIAATGNTLSTQRVNTLLRTLNKHFIRVDAVDIAPDTFFRMASDAIEACLSLWKDVAQQTGDFVAAKK